MNFQLFIAYFRLFRFQNLLMIVLTQCLLRYFIIKPFFEVERIGLAFSDFNFFLLVLSTILITAGGYAINDYFDLRIDRINKPNKMVLGRIIPRRHAIIFHQLFTASGVLIGFYLSWIVGSIKPSFIFLIISFVLWFYSVKFKHIYLIGNITVASLSSFVLFIVWMFEFFALKSEELVSIVNIDLLKIFLCGFVFFAFITSFSREIIKDIEDIEGDKRVGCRTIPIVSGIRFTCCLVNIFLLIEIIVLLYFVYLLYLQEFYLLIAYLATTVILPLFFIMFKVLRSSTRKEFHFISCLLKVVMITGILSMILIFISQQ